MKQPSQQETLELEVTDFGPIVEAKVDLRPLTVFVGPSNTGKSYLAILIYALHRYFSGLFIGDLRYQWMIKDDTQLPQKTIEALADFEQRRSDSLAQRLPDGNVVLGARVTDALRSIYDSQGGQLGTEIGRCFGINEVGKQIRRRNRDFASVVMRRNSPDAPGNSEHRLLLGARTEYKATISEDLCFRSSGASEDVHIFHPFLEFSSQGQRPTTETFIGSGGTGRWTNFLIRLTEHTLPCVLGPLHLPAVYLPADRTGVMHAHSAVVNATIGSAAMAGLRPATPMLSGVLADFLRQLIQLDRPRRRQSKPPPLLAQRIEEAVLGGSVSVNRSEVTGYPHFAYRPDGWKTDLPLTNASSMVSELAPVVLYLRHVIQPDNVLIIEEPESHLHPAMQVEFTRQLALLVRSGIRVIITTHSEWVLEELANIVRRSSLPGTKRKRTDATAVALRPDEVGAWLFKPKSRPKGSVVEEVKLDEETGLYPTGYDAVSEALYNESARLFNRIQEGNSE